jgi:trehalose 6-phosphate synthase/phosphatase
LSTQTLQSSFVNDYQFAVLPSFLGRDQETIMFWHIPWPTNVNPVHVEALRDIASGMLQAKLVGFHTQEYLFNFLEFVERYCPSFNAHRDSKTVTHLDSMAQRLHVTRLIATPLGSNFGYWNRLSHSTESSELVFPYRTLPYVLSVDRIDYTKGVSDRLIAIDHFFRMFPQWLQKVHFVQVGARSRVGLTEFDRYFETCSLVADRLNRRWRKDNWQPLLWIDQPVAPVTLAKVYAGAAAMLINPWRDGLNLTAKEFVASRDVERNPGVLALSNGAGVWKEIGEHTVSVCPSDPIGIAVSTLKCLEMDKTEKQLRMLALKNSLQQNDLDNWCHRFFGAYNTSINEALLTHAMRPRGSSSLVVT